jgi:prepilin peptidase CpaA
MTAQVWIAILVGLAAAVDDLARRRIANWIPAAALAGGFGWQIGQNGVWTGSLHALGGTAVGFAVFLIFYLMGGMGGGDVKLMAGFGALLGLPGVLWAALWTAAFGGVIAIGAVAWQSARQGLQRVLRRTAVESSQGRDKQETIPYAPAIVLGVWLALVPKG